MNRQKIAGIAALVLLVAALNIMVWTQEVFSTFALVPLVVALGCGLAWLGFVFGAAKTRGSLRGRAAGGINAAVSSAVFLGICVVLYAFISAWDVSWDLTKEGRRELAPQTIQVLRTMTREVEVTCFFLKVDDELVMIARDKTMRFLEQCRKYTELLKIDLADPQVDLPRLQAMELNAVSPQGTIVVHAGGRKRVITLSGGSPRLEEWDFTNALVNVLRNAEPKVCFLTGHSERDILNEHETDGASMLMNALQGESYLVERLTIKVSSAEVPRDCDILVINNPNGDLHPLEIDAIQRYLDGGGRLLLLIDPWLAVTADSTRKEYLRPWLEERYGIRIGTNVVVSEARKNMWQAELNNDNGPFEEIDEGFGEYRGAFHANHPVTRGFDQRMLMQAARTVEAVEEPPAGVTLTELLRTTPEFWAESDVVGVKDRKEVHQDVDEPGGPLPLAVAAVTEAKDSAPDSGRPADSLILVVGDSKIASNGGLQIPGHYNFVLNVFAWLSSNKELIAIRPTGKDDPPLLLNAHQQRAAVWISTLFSLQVVLSAGIVTYVVRRKYR